MVQVAILAVLSLASLINTGFASVSIQRCHYNQVYNQSRSCPPSCGDKIRTNCKTNAGCVCPFEYPYNVGGFCESSCPVQNLQWEIQDMVSHLRWHHYGSAANYTQTQLQTCIQRGCASREEDIRIDTVQREDHVENSCTLIHEPIPPRPIQIKLITTWKTFTGKIKTHKKYFQIGYSKSAVINIDTNLTAPVVSTRSLEAHFVKLTVQPSRKVVCNTKYTEYTFFLSHDNTCKSRRTEEKTTRVHSSSFHCDNEGIPLFELEPAINGLDSNTSYFACVNYRTNELNSKASAIGSYQFKTKEEREEEAEDQIFPFLIALIAVGLIILCILCGFCYCFLKTKLGKDQKKNKEVIKRMNATGIQLDGTDNRNNDGTELKQEDCHALKRKSTGSCTDAGYSSDTTDKKELGVMGDEKESDEISVTQKLISNTGRSFMNDYDSSNAHVSNKPEPAKDSSFDSLRMSNSSGYVTKACGDSDIIPSHGSRVTDCCQTEQHCVNESTATQFTPSSGGYAAKSLDNSHCLTITSQQSVDSERSLIYAKVQHEPEGTLFGSNYKRK